MLPPYGEPAGPHLARDEIVPAWLAGAKTGVSDEFHIEGDVLLAARFTHLAILVDDSTVLIRTDVPDDVGPLRAMLEATLRRSGIELVDEDAMLGDAVGIEVAGLRGVVWSLWARDTELGRAALMRRAAGELEERAWSADAAEGARIADILAEIERDLES